MIAEKNKYKKEEPAVEGEATTTEAIAVDEPEQGGKEEAAVVEEPITVDA